MDKIKNETQEVSTIQKNENGLTTVDLNGALPDLELAETYPFDLMADYWTPEKSMESKRVFFDKIASRMVLDQQTGEAIELECAHFIQVISGEAKTVSNGSKRLVGAIEANRIERGTPLLITYLGKKKNSTNSYQSDNWSIRPLSVRI
jgi:hypothetical protein